MIQTKTDIHYLKRAIKIAQSPLSRVSPNPYVGAVIVKNGQIIGEGFHPKPYDHHAEIYALQNITESAINATIYVSLEPCCHFGKTPPCTDAIIQAGIKRVVFASQDNNPKVHNKSQQILLNAGIIVDYIPLKEAYELNRHFFTNQMHHRPYVTLKSALSLDGKIATQTYDSKWITGDLSRQKAHQLRIQHDAILIGKKTLLNDNPELTARYELTEEKQPIRILLLRNFNDIHQNLNLWQTAHAKTWIIYPETTEVPSELSLFFKKNNVELYPLKAQDKSVDLPNFLEFLYQKNICSLLLEGGSAIYNAFLSENLVDECALFYGPKLIGHQNAPSLWDKSPITQLSFAPQLTIIKSETLGDDLFVSARFTQGDL